MKKTLLIIFALACFTISKANPLPSPPPSIILSELAFDNNGKWIIELLYVDQHNGSSQYPVDSVFITSSTGKSKLKGFKSGGYTRLIMVRNDSLFSNLNINPLGDSIQVSYYIHSNSNFSGKIIYGNFVNSKLFCPASGQSIALINYGAYLYSYSPYQVYTYSIDKSSTLGAANDSTGMCGTIKGKIYDSNDQILLNSTLKFFGDGFFDITPHVDGSFSTRIYSYNNHITKLYYYEGQNRFIVDIVPIDVSIRPDTVVTADIHIQKVTAIKDIKNDPVSVFQIFPNPIKDLSFNYQVSIPVKSSNSYLELISISGQKIAQYPVSDDNGKINLPATVKNGTYTVRLFVNNENYGTSKILIAR